MNKSKNHIAYLTLLGMLFFSACSDSVSQDVLSGESSSENLIADAGPDMTIDLPYTFVFENPACDAVKVEWDFDDGKKAQGFKVEHEFRSAGRYIVKVTLTAPGGQTITDTAVITVYPKDTDKDLLEDAIDDDPLNGSIESPRDSKIFYLSTFDGEQLECQLYLPAGKARCPAVLLAHGWASSMDEMRSRAIMLRDNGYAAMIYSSRGWGKSSGLVRLDSTEYEVKDAIMLINWLSARKFIIEETKHEWLFDNGRIFYGDFNQDGVEDADDIPGDEDRDFIIGMSGCSYGGSLQIMAASFDHRIDAISPERTWNSLNQALCPNDSMKVFWAGGFYLMGILRVFEGNGVDPLLTNFIFTLLGTNDFKPEMKDQLKLRSPSERITRVVAPALIIQGEMDTVFDLNQAVANFRQIKANGVEAKMYWYSGGHGYFPVTTPFIEQIVLDWMNRHLKGEAGADTGAEFRYDAITEDWKPGDEPEIKSGTWPMVDQNSETRLVLHGADDSYKKLACADESVDFINYSETADLYSGEESFKSSQMINIPFVKSSFSEMQGLQGTLKDIYPPYDNELTSVTFESDVFKEDAEITGIPHATLFLSATCSDITYFIKLYDVPADASIANEDKKLNTDAKVINWHVTPFRVYGSSKNTLQKHEIDLRGITYVIKKGHKLRLTIATSDFFFLHSRKLGEGFIWHDAAHPSALYLPVVGR